MVDSEGTSTGSDWRFGIVKGLFYSGFKKVVVTESCLGKASLHARKEAGEPQGCSTEVLREYRKDC